MTLSLLAALLASAPLLTSVPEPKETFSVGSCSLYCAVVPSLSDSRHIAPQGRVTYDPDNADDGRADTAWVTNGGPGEWLLFIFREAHEVEIRLSLGVNRLYILNGYAKSDML
jgi:hypothetical protein